MERYLDLHFAGRSGYALVGFRTPRIEMTVHGPRYGGPFRQVAYLLPRDRSRLVTDAEGAYESQDVYICPLLRSHANRRLLDSRPLPGRFVWLDIDGWTADVEEALVALGLPVHLVDSGGKGLRRHAYIDVGQDLPGDEIYNLSAALAGALRADTAGGNNKALRLPGTWNHKPRILDGDGVGVVRWLPMINAGVPGSAEPLRVLLREQRLPVRLAAAAPRRAPKIEPRPSSAACVPVLDAADAFRKTMASGARHSALQAPLMRLLRAGRQGHRGVPHLLTELRQEFILATSDDRGGDQPAGDEYDRAIASTRMSSAGERGEYPICSCDITAYKLALDDGSNFSSRGRHTERKIMQSLVREADRTKSRKVSKSQYQIAEDAECGQQTVSRVLARLEAGPLIEKRLSMGRGMTTVLLAEPCRTESTEVPFPAGREVDSLLRVGPTHAVFGSQGLRGNQELTFDALDVLKVPFSRGQLLAVKNGHGQFVRDRRRGWRDVSCPSGSGGQSPSEVALRSGQVVATVRRHLNQLKDAGLAIKVNRLWYRTEWVPDLVAQERGIDNVPSRRRQRHDAGRAAIWESRSELPVGHTFRVDRAEESGEVLYLEPETGQVLYRSSLRDEDDR